MKKIKYIFLLIIIFLVSGCSVKYNLRINNGKVDETIVIPYDKNYKGSYENVLYSIKPTKSYKLKIKDSSAFMEMKNETLTILKTNYAYSHCFNTISVEEDDDYYYIGTSKGFNCMTYSYMDIDNLEISFKTYNIVKENNADSNFLGTYKWNITKDNYAEKNITFVVSKKEHVWYYNYKGIIPGILSVLAVVLVAAIIVRYFSRRSEKANKF